MFVGFVKPTKSGKHIESSRGEEVKEGVGNGGMRALRGERDRAQGAAGMREHAAGAGARALCRRRRRPVPACLFWALGAAGAQSRRECEPRACGHTRVPARACGQGVRTRTRVRALVHVCDSLCMLVWGLGFRVEGSQGLGFRVAILTLAGLRRRARGAERAGAARGAGKPHVAEFIC